MNALSIRPSVPATWARYAPPSPIPSRPSGDTLSLTSAPVQPAHVGFGERLGMFASDAVDAGQLFTVAGSAHWLGQVAYLNSMVLGPVLAGVGLGLGGVEIARSAFAKTPQERNHRLIQGGLDMAIGASSMLATTGIAPAAGAIAATALIGLKFIHGVLESR